MRNAARGAFTGFRSRLWRPMATIRGNAAVGGSMPATAATPYRLNTRVGCNSPA